MLNIDFKNEQLQLMIENTLINWDRNFEDAKRNVMDKNHKYIKNLQTNLQKNEVKIQTLESKLQHNKVHKQDSSEPPEIHVNYHGNLDIFDSQYQANKMREMATTIKQQISSAYTNKLLMLKTQISKLQNQFSQTLKQNQRDAKQLHMQHQIEKAALQEQVQYLYQRYADKKKAMKKVEEENGKL